MGLRAENGKNGALSLAWKELSTSTAKLIRRLLSFLLFYVCIRVGGNLSRTMMLSSFPLLSGDDDEDDIQN